MNNKDNKLIFEQYTNPRSTNKHPVTTIVETIDHVMKLPRVNRHGKTLVSEADIVDVLDKLNRAGIGKRISPDTQKQVDDYKDNGMWNPEHDEQWNLNPDEYPKKDQDQDEQPADDQAKLDVDVVSKLQAAADENGQIDLLDALRIIGAFEEDK